MSASAAARPASPLRRALPTSSWHVGWALAMLTFFQAIVLGVLQGVTELLPVSSLAIR